MRPPRFVVAGEEALARIYAVEHRLWVRVLVPLVIGLTAGITLSTLLGVLPPVFALLGVLVICGLMTAWCLWTLHELHKGERACRQVMEDYRSHLAEDEEDRP